MKKTLKNPKLRIARNAWGNWYGYRSGRNVIGFTNTAYETQEQMAARWVVEGGPENFNPTHIQ